MTWTIVGNGKEDTNSEEGWTLLRNGDALAATSSTSRTRSLRSEKADVGQRRETPENLIERIESGRRR